MRVMSLPSRINRLVADGFFGTLPVSNCNSALYTLIFGFNPGDATGTQEIGV